MNYLRVSRLCIAILGGVVLLLSGCGIPSDEITVEPPVIVTEISDTGPYTFKNNLDNPTSVTGYELFYLYVYTDSDSIREYGDFQEAAETLLKSSTVLKSFNSNPGYLNQHYGRVYYIDSSVDVGQAADSHDMLLRFSRIQINNLGEPVTTFKNINSPDLSVSLNFNDYGISNEFTKATIEVLGYMDDESDSIVMDIDSGSVASFPVGRLVRMENGDLKFASFWELNDLSSKDVSHLTALSEGDNKELYVLFFVITEGIDIDNFTHLVSEPVILGAYKIASDHYASSNNTP